MTKTKLNWVLRVFSLIFVLAAAVIGWQQYVISSNQSCILAEDARIGDVSVGGLTLAEAEQRINTVYSLPVQVDINSSIIQFTPEELGFDLLLDEMISEASRSCVERQSWTRFWNKLWNQSHSSITVIPLLAEIDPEQLQNAIQDKITNRYTWGPSPVVPLPKTTRFQVGSPGQTIDQDQLVEKLKAALQSPEQRVVSIKVNEIPAPIPDIEHFEYLTKDIIDQYDFNGLVEIFVRRPSDGLTVSIAYQNGSEVTPGIAFSAASTMKIPIMVSTMWDYNLPLDQSLHDWLEDMIVLSENPPADRLMEQINLVRGPLMVTEDMRALGLNNTFIAGYFYLGAPLLELYETPANTRTDIRLDLDLYNQTTPVDIGELLTMIYHCAEIGEGQLQDVSGAEITQEECELMIDILSSNRIGALSEAGTPEGTRIAHKHGWSEESDGLLHTVSDVGIIYGPENDFVFSIFIYSQGQLLFEDANFLTARLAQMYFNGMNPDHQIAWWFPEDEE